MERRRFLQILISAPCAGAVLSASGGCGSILYPERRMAPRSDQIDWKVVALDGLGLILFFIPGVVAFAVDFYTGAIYLPANNFSTDYEARKPELTRQDVPREQLNIPIIESMVSEHLGKNVSLQDDNARVSQLSQIESFNEQVASHAQDTRFGHKLQSFFSPWKTRLGIEA